ncbi:hypothetical protein BJX66DRAFT_313493 [Aspergillus keveii]|uniref:Uncharacterized protein n=1 Tax=Aspergillus keveii TaxID=714993 RepID=A0ABR4FS55_9EURO
MAVSNRESTLEVVSSPSHRYSDLEPASQTTLYPHDGLHPWNPPAIEPKDISERGQICGIKKTTFWILVAAAVVILAAAGLGAGLGVGLSQNSNEGSQDPVTTTIIRSATAAPTPTTTATPTLSETSITASRGTINDETVILYRDCPSSNNTLYSIEIDTTTYQFRKECNAHVVHEGQYPNLVRQVAASLNDCMNLCAMYNYLNTTTDTDLDFACSAVCWRNGFEGNDWPGVCFGYPGLDQESEVPGGFLIEPDTLCDSAVWVNTP